MASIELITKEDLEELKALIMGYAKPLMTVEEVASYLRLSPHTIRHKIADQTFILGVHYSDKAGKILFAKEKLDTWLWEVTKESNNVSIQKNNRVWIDLFANGARIRKSTGLEWTASNVKKVEKELIPQLRMGVMTGTLSLQKERIKTVRYYAESFIVSKRQTTVAKTHKRYESIIENGILPLLGDTPIKDLRISHIDKWRSDLLQRFTAKTVKEYQIVFRGIFQKALQDEEVNKNPFDALDSLKVKKPNVVPFMPHEVKLILDTAQGWFKNYLALGFMTGMRVGEIVALKWENVNLETREIYVCASRSMGVEGTTKTQSSIRYIPIIDTLVPFIESQKEFSGDKEYVFVNHFGRPFYDYKTIGSNQWVDILKKCGLTHRRMYEMRHTCATNLLMSGQYSVNEIASVLGHTTPQMLFERYTRSISAERKPFNKTIDIYSVNENKDTIMAL